MPYVPLWEQIINTYHMSSSSSILSYGWEEVNVSDWDDGALSVEDSLDNLNLKGNQESSSEDSLYELYVKKVKMENSLDLKKEVNCDVIEKTGKGEIVSNINLVKRKDHKLSESEDTSEEEHAPSLHDRTTPTNSQEHARYREIHEGGSLFSRKTLNQNENQNTSDVSVDIDRTRNLESICSGPEKRKMRFQAREVTEKHQSTSDLSGLDEDKDPFSSDDSLKDPTYLDSGDGSSDGSSDDESARGSQNLLIEKNIQRLNNKDFVPDRMGKYDMVENIACQLLNKQDFVSHRIGQHITVEDIADADIWMIQCPHDLDPKKLENKELDFSGISEFTVPLENGNKIYATTPCAARWKTFSCLLPSAKKKQIEPVVVNTAGQIIITEKVMHSGISSTAPATAREVEFPKLKVRHPLFGAEYVKELDIRKQRLLGSSSEKTRKRKKRKRREMRNGVSLGEISIASANSCILNMSEDMEAALDVEVPTKKRRFSESYSTTINHSDDKGMLKLNNHSKKYVKELDIHNPRLLVSSSENTRKRKKKKRREMRNDMSLGEISIAPANSCILNMSEDVETALDVEVPTKKRRFSESYSTTINHSDDKGMLKLNNHSKSKSLSFEGANESVELDSYTDHDISIKKKKKKKKKRLDCE